MSEPPQPTRPPSRRPRSLLAVRLSAAVLGLAIATAAIVESRAERLRRAEVVELWRGSGAALRHPGPAERARRDPDPEAAVLALARALFADASAPADLTHLPPSEAAAEAEKIERRLALSREHAQGVLARRPASWEAALVIGGSRLVTLVREGSQELYSRPLRWREPLLHAKRLAPGEAEPGRLLASGVLASWHALNDADRAAGRALLARELRDRMTLQQLLPVWAAVAASPGELASVLPATAHSYDLLQQVARAARDWEGLCAARERWRTLLDAELEGRLARAIHRLQVGDRAGARGELLAIVAAAPLERRFAPLLVRAMDRLPAGPVPPQQGAAMTAWLRWALRLREVGQEPLPAATLDRLTGLAPELREEEMALAALAAGRLDKAELWERRSDRMWSEEWAPYAAAKADALLERGRLDEAAAVLAEVHRSYQGRWAYSRAAGRLQTARRRRPEEGGASASAWPAVAWTFLRGEASLEVVAERPASGIAVTVDVAPPEGSAVELTWDGAVVGCYPATTGAVLRVPLALTAAPHLLGVLDLGPERIAPGAVWLDGVAADLAR
jgi:hypothetical protein